MRPRFVIFLLVLVAVILAIMFWLRPARRADISGLIQETAQSTNLPVGNKTIASQGVPNAPPATTSPTISNYPATTNRPSPQEVIRKFVEENNAPIEFYGQVIDQDSNALSGAKIEIGIRHWTMPDPSVPEPGSKEIHLEQVAGADGRFEFHGATGDGFGVGITKEGYELEPNRYGFGPTAGSYDNPVIFKMWSTNIHEKLISGEKVFNIVPDGRPYFINLTDGTIAESGAGDLKVWVKRPEQITYGQRYDWSCEVDMINGGLLAQPLGSAMYSAPTAGYASSFQFEQMVGSGWGDSTGERRFYVTLNNGQIYGRISIELYAYYNNQIPGLIRLSYAINPSGSRILR